MAKEPTYMGGIRGGRKPQGTYYPSLRPGHSPLDQVRQATRHFGATQINTSRAGGGIGGTRDDGVPEPEGQWVTANLLLADNSVTPYGVGAIAAIAGGHVIYWIRRNYATPVYTMGQFYIWHDGTNGHFGPPVSIVDSAAAEADVTFTCDVNAGNLRLIITVSDATPDATADVKLFLTPFNVP